MTYHNGLIFVTVFHETAHTFLPVKEAYWLSEEWRKKNLRYFPFYGRGYLQTTWKVNYQYYSKLLGVDFVNNPDLMMNPKYFYFFFRWICKRSFYRKENIRSV